MSATTRPTIIQGGMGVAISDWRLARAVSTTGQLGVVSGTALDVVLARRLQDGDPDGDVRRALAAFPVPAVAAWILDTYFVEGGIPGDTLYRPVPRHTLTSARSLLELTVAGGFVEVWLAKQGHANPVGINLLRKIELPLPATLYGAILAGVDYVLVGAGSPAEIPGIARRLAAHEDVTLDVRVIGARSSDGLGAMTFSPKAVLPQPLPSLTPPQTLAIVASVDLATALAGDPTTRPDGFVVEGPSAGGHNAPPRGPREVDDIGQPVYGERDVVDTEALVALGLPFWLAGSYAARDRLAVAIAQGAAGVQVGTAFAFCDESGMSEPLKHQARRLIDEGRLTSRADWRVSPTGFPFRVADLEGTISDPATVASRQAVCDLGVLRAAYKKEDGTVGFRCPSEPTAQYLRKGGSAATVPGRICLCNALLATAGMPQRRPDGSVEAPLLTCGDDLSPVADLMSGSRRPDRGYTARDVIDSLLGHPA
ncbi:MAG TPA: nitronate monooxygenase [Dermatophilaceae bacterium]|nr:nitronate monooxygenase [Dermatophilaceae bacterium]